MIIDGRDCAFKALYRVLPVRPWELSKEYFFNQKEVMAWVETCKQSGYDQYEVIWPVSLLDGDIIEVPNQEELE